MLTDALDKRIVQRGNANGARNGAVVRMEEEFLLKKQKEAQLAALQSEAVGLHLPPPSPKSARNEFLY